MRQRCKEVGLEPAGKRETLKRRLKEHFKSEKLIEAGNDCSDCNDCNDLGAYRETEGVVYFDQLAGAACS